MVSDEKLPYEVPPYPCVIFLAKTRHIRYEGRNNGEEYGKSGAAGNEELEYLHYRVTSYEDMDHVDYCRKFKSFAVVGHHHIEKLVDEKTRQTRQDALAMIMELDNIVNPPEARRAREAMNVAAAAASAEKESAVKEALNERAKRVRSEKESA